MPLKDPPRLLDPGSNSRDFVRDALDAGRADRPRADQLARLAQRLPISGPPPGGPAPTPPSGGSPAAPIAAIPSALPGAIVGAILGLAVIGLHALLTRSEAPSSVDHGSPAALVTAPAKAAAPDHARRDEPATTPSPTAPRALPAPAITAAASAEPSPRVAAAAPDEAPAAPSIAAGSGQDFAPGSAEGTLGAGSPAVDTETETQLLQRAQDALGSSPARALDLVNRHVTRFPHATLGQEREVIAVDALVRLGRIGEARSRAAAFAARFPTSAHLRRLGALVPSAGIDSAVHKDPGAPAPTGQ